MDIKHLKNFVTVVNEGVNLSKAAKKLHISQPPLSQQMKNIEDTLNVQIFERGKRNLQLTQNGEVLYKRAKKIVQLYEEMEKEMTEMGSGVKGQLNIAISTFYSSLFQNSTTFRNILQFSQKYPGVKLKIMHTDGKNLQERMENKEMDFAIINLPIEEQIFDHFKLELKNFSFIMPASWELPTSTDLIAFNDIRHYPLILLKRDTGIGLYEKVLEHCAKNNFKPKLVAESNNTNTIMSLVNAGIGATILPSTSVDKLYNFNVKVIRFTDANFFTETVLVWLKERYLSAPARAFLSILQEKNL
ncbi:DNA-binding transcriptional LysR family regulator [Lysinibacillus composti]|nr:LysR family transcriptional regulator [Lysinibacillus composti]MBM7608758.1 DNA-binding transcriptional LysR family regulator [Lysinibacillus composti]